MFRPTMDSKHGTMFFENKAKAPKLIEHPIPWQISTSNLSMGAKEGVNYTSIQAEPPDQTEMGGRRHHAPASLHCYRLYRSFGRPHGTSGRERGRENLLPAARLEPRTVHSVADRYTGCTIPARHTTNYPQKVLLLTVHMEIRDN